LAQPNKRDEPRFGTNGAPRGRNQPSGAARRRQSSKQVFQHRGAGRRHGGHGAGQYGASRDVRSALARSANILLLRVLARPPCSSVLNNLLPRLGPAARCQHRWVSAGQPEDGRISRADARRAVRAEAPANQCVIGTSAENPRSPRGFFRLAVRRALRSPRRKPWALRATRGKVVPRVCPVVRTTVSRRGVSLQDGRDGAVGLSASGRLRPLRGHQGGVDDLVLLLRAHR